MSGENDSFGEAKDLPKIMQCFFDVGMRRGGKEKEKLERVKGRL